MVRIGIEAQCLLKLCSSGHVAPLHVIGIAVAGPQIVVIHALIAGQLAVGNHRVPFAKHVIAEVDGVAVHRFLRLGLRGHHHQ